MKCSIEDFLSISFAFWGLPGRDDVALLGEGGLLGMNGMAVAVEGSDAFGFSVETTAASTSVVRVSRLLPCGFAWF